MSITVDGGTLRVEGASDETVSRIVELLTQARVEEARASDGPAGPVADDEAPGRV